MFLLLAALGAICCFVGFILFVVAGFRVSVLWGLIALFLPFLLSFGGNILGAILGLSGTPWWFWLTQIVFFLPWIVLMAMHWDKAKNGFMMYFAGVVFFAAAIVSIDAESKQKIAVFLQASGQPIPGAMADWLGIKKAGAATDKPGTAGAPNGSPGAAGAGLDKATSDASALPVAVATGLETQEQVLAAVAELNDRAAKLKARKDMLKGSPDQLALNQLTADIKAFNERLKVVTAREVELKMIPAPTPTPPPAPAIPTTVVIPQSTPTPPPPKKK